MVSERVAALVVSGAARRRMDREMRVESENGIQGGCWEYRGRRMH